MKNKKLMWILAGSVLLFIIFKSLIDFQMEKTPVEKPVATSPVAKVPVKKAPVEKPVATSPLPKPEAKAPVAKVPVEKPVATSPVAIHDSLRVIDSILERMELGNISFNTPESMKLNELALIHLLLGVEKSIKDLEQMIEAEGQKVGARIRVSNRMEARLSGQNFEITAITPEKQAVSRTEVTEWKWEIKPKSVGTQFLHLTLSAIVIVEGTSTLRAIRTFDRRIEVQVTLSQRVNDFVKNNWQWLWAAILVPLIGWLWKRKRGTSKQAKKQ